MSSRFKKVNNISLRDLYMVSLPQGTYNVTDDVFTPLKTFAFIGNGVIIPIFMVFNCVQFSNVLSPI
tara:strand:+ start:20987 stop:21187 length:201 start_codon:yes stop_codon:yes gene_type:complete